MSTTELIAEITHRLIAFYLPERIYLFGSEARGESGPDSDLDFLVVVPDWTSKAIMNGAGGYLSLNYIAASVDVIPWRSSDFKGRAAHVASSLPATVVREGKLLYDSGRVAHSRTSGVVART